MAVKKKVIKLFKGVPLRGASPVVECALYNKLLVTVGRVYKLRTLDVECIMLAGVFGGCNTWQIIEMAGLHRKTIYPTMDRLEASGYVFSPLPPERSRRPLYLTELGKEVQHEVNRLWLDVVRSSSAGL